MKGCWLFLAAVAREFQILCRLLGGQRFPNDRDIPVLVNPGTNTVAVQTGIGHERAQQSTRWAIQQFQPQRLVLAGFAGGLANELTVGDIVMASRSIAVRDGWPVDGIDLDMFLVLKAHIGPIATSEQLVATPRQKQLLAQSTGALAVDMESHAVASVCQQNGVPVTVVRAISDDCRQTLDSRFLSVMTPAGELAPARLARLLVTRPTLIPALVQTARHVNVAARSLERVCREIGRMKVEGGAKK